MRDIPGKATGKICYQEAHMLSMKHFRFLAMAILAALAVTLAAALPGVSADGGDDDGAPFPRSGETSGDGQAPPFPEKAELNYPNLGSRLDQLVASVEAGQATAQGAASNSTLHSGESVAVTIYLSGNVDEVVGFLENNGGDPRNVGEDYIEAYVPVTLLGQVSEQPGVIRVREIVPPQPLYGPVTSQGVQAHAAAAWHQAGYTGQGVKVGIIDTGFKGFSALIGTELPEPAGLMCFTDIDRPTTNLEDCETGEADDTHGTIVAESLMDIAPEVDLYIGHPVSRADLQAIADWMVSEGVSVINYSAGWTFNGPGDGKSPFSDSPLETVDRAVTGGAVWVNAAGNQARKTWFSRAPFLDQDGDGNIEFAAGEELNSIDLDAGDEITVQLRWDGSWGGARTNLDLGLWKSGFVRPVALSLDPQSGGPGHVPFELIKYEVPSDGAGTYDIGVRHFSGSEPDWIQLMVFKGPSIEYYTKTGSIWNPAESANSGMLAVGAAHWNDVRAIEPYSSRGPTPDGRIKPDIVGAASGATALTPLNEFNVGFSGTSQASPHVAGLAALVRQRFPDYSPVEVASYLKDNAEQRHGPDPNNIWGYGFAQLPPPDGTEPPVPPPSNAFTRNPEAEFNTLADASNRAPGGIWSDGETMWVSDWEDDKIYAYDMATKERVSGKDFNTLEAAGNTGPFGIWSDGETMWVTDLTDDKIYAYDMVTKARVSGKDFDTLIAARNPRPRGIWSDGETMWVADQEYVRIYAYDMASKARVFDRDFDTLIAARNWGPRGIWSDGLTMWVADLRRDKVFAYDMATGARVPGREFNTLDAAGNWVPRGLWSDGTTMWVSDWEDDKIYAYPMAQAESAADRDALVAFYNATGGADWTNNTNWLTDAPMGQWHGVTIDASGNVTELDLRSNQLTGAIPSSLGNLSNLTYLNLHNNQLTGKIPTELGNLSYLTYLYLDDNRLDGTIPAELGDLSNLTDLSLSNNQLDGTIPAELGDLTDLELLALGGNELTGIIPAWLGGLTKLEGLYLWGNRLTGTIPSEVSRLTSLKILELDGNELAGNIPSELSRLTSLEILTIGRNELTGTIPSELSSLTSLEILALGGNELTGTIPTWLGSLTKLEGLYLWGNGLTGEIPAELASLTQLQFLDLGGNELTGTIPAWLGSLTKLTELSLWGNGLSGEIPAELGSLPNLVNLWLSDNQLTGEIPAELGGLSNLELLSLSVNQLSGTIPAELGGLSNLELLSLSVNQLSGTIPEELGNLTSLEELYLWGNQLSGTVPQSMVALTMLESFAFHHNAGLCAPIDDAFQTWLGSIATVLGSSCALADSPEDRAVLGELHSATGGANWTYNANWLSEHLTREWYGVTNDANGRTNGLFLTDNQLTGQIPSGLGSLTNLESLYLNYNQLTGEIPSELGRLTNLTALRLDGNQLTGEIPAELSHLTNLTVLRLAGNQLTGCVPDGLQDVADNDFAQLGLPFCPPGDPLVSMYDVNGDGAIDIGELFSAIDDYFAGLIDIGDLFTLIDLYFSGPA